MNRLTWIILIVAIVVILGILFAYNKKGSTKKDSAKANDKEDLEKVVESGETPPMDFEEPAFN